MSSQRGNTERTRPQKHKNRTAFKNTLHDTSHRTKSIVNTQVSDVCQRCKEIIEWKIKYKKYKPLTQPRKCVKCEQKTVKQAYHVMCGPCGRDLKQCTKCCQSKEVIVHIPSDKESVQLDNEMKDMLKTLSERKRRTFIRFMNKGKKSADDDSSNRTSTDKKNELMEKLNALKLEEGDDDDFSSEDDLSDFE